MENSYVERFKIKPTEYLNFVIEKETIDNNAWMCEIKDGEYIFATREQIHRAVGGRPLGLAIFNTKDDAKKAIDKILQKEQIKKDFIKNNPPEYYP